MTGLPELLVLLPKDSWQGPGLSHDPWVAAPCPELELASMFKQGWGALPKP